MKPLVRQKLEILRSEYEGKPYSELASMEWCELAPLEIDGHTYQPSAFTESYQDKLLLVVQLQRKRFIGWKQTECIGSIITENGVLERVNEEFLWNEIGHP